VVVSGDSCGGLLGLGALVEARDEGLALPACFVSISGWFDVSVAAPVESGEDGRDPFLTAEWVRNRGRDYAAGQVDLDDPRLSPVSADLAGLPPLYLPAGQYDTLRYGTEALAQAALDAGVAVTAESWPGMVHGWQGLVTAGVPEAAVAFARVRAYLDDFGV
jgi:monoterpene epsilon-lactone hydrolase